MFGGAEVIERDYNVLIVIIYNVLIVIIGIVVTFFEDKLHLTCVNVNGLMKQF